MPLCLPQNRAGNSSNWMSCIPLCILRPGSTLTSVFSIVRTCLMWSFGAIVRKGDCKQCPHMNCPTCLLFMCTNKTLKSSCADFEDFLTCFSSATMDLSDSEWDDLLNGLLWDPWWQTVMLPYEWAVINCYLTEYQQNFHITISYTLCLAILVKYSQLRW